MTHGQIANIFTEALAKHLPCGGQLYYIKGEKDEAILEIIVAYAERKLITSWSVDMLLSCRAFTISEQAEMAARQINIKFGFLSPEAK